MYFNPTTQELIHHMYQSVFIFISNENQKAVQHNDEVCVNAH